MNENTLTQSHQMSTVMASIERTNCARKMWPLKTDWIAVFLVFLVDPNPVKKIGTGSDGAGRLSTRAGKFVVNALHVGIVAVDLNVGMAQHD